MTYFVYILRCADETYYVGRTNDIKRRVSQHKSGSNRRAYTYPRRPVELVWSQEVGTENEAKIIERKIKQWSRAQKDSLINNQEVISINSSKNRIRKKR